MMVVSVRVGVLMARITWRQGSFCPGEVGRGRRSRAQITRKKYQPTH